MSKPAGAEFITPPDTLQRKLGGRLGVFDEQAVARAQAALQAMSSEFGAWLEEEVSRLEYAHAMAKADGAGEHEREELYLRAHDLKGLGVTYGSPMISRVAGSLCKLLDSPDARRRAPTALLDAHVNAVRASVRDGIATLDHPVGAALVRELETLVAAFGGVSD